MILYGLKTCDTCRKALKSIDKVEFRDVRAEGLPKDVAQQAGGSALLHGGAREIQREDQRVGGRGEGVHQNGLESL